MSTAPVTAGIERDTPRLLFFHDQRSGKSRRADGFLAQVLQHGGNHQTFMIHRIDVGQRPDLAERFRVAETPTLLVVQNKKVQARLETPTGCKDIELLLRPWLRRQTAPGAGRRRLSSYTNGGIANSSPAAIQTDAHGQKCGAETAQ
jgi:thioredoxin-like negative regulator of GroEL